MNETKLRKLGIKDIIIDETEDFLVINKPPFISTLEDRNDPVNILSLTRTKFPDAQVCHRLDKETSGVLIIAKNNDFYKYMSSLFEKREVNKLYHAVVEGRLEIEEEVIEKPIFSSQSRSRIDFEAGKPSITMIKTLDIFKFHTLLACMPFTGRMHQIRIHLADSGSPICADHLYGGHDIYLSDIKKDYKLGRNKEESPMIRRIALHAAAISFPYKEGEELYNVKAPYPKDYSVLIKQLEKNKL